MKTWLIPLLVATALAAALPAFAGDATPVERGRWLVTTMACVDCHTAHRPGPDGPEPDPDLYMAGHPESLAMPPAPALPEGPWMIVAAGSMTAWAGPWGVSFPANLTPDEETGLGRWTADDFVAAVRSGRHQGRGRAILPPMPLAPLRNLSDEDLHAIFAYLRSLPPIHNRVPAPRPPASAG
jgi:mono/diheme cytochrome c family protein